MALKPVKRTLAKPEPERKRKPHIDPQVHEVIKELRVWADRLPKGPAANGTNPAERLRSMADRLELSSQAGFEDSYGYCQELLDPHIKADHNGMVSITQDSLIPSVNESLDYLIQFWIANRDKPGIDLCL
jgi:hypothetical protein